MSTVSTGLTVRAPKVARRRWRAGWILAASLVALLIGLCATSAWAQPPVFPPTPSLPSTSTTQPPCQVPMPCPPPTPPTNPAPSPPCTGEGCIPQPPPPPPPPGPGGGPSGGGESSCSLWDPSTWLDCIFR